MPSCARPANLTCSIGPFQIACTNRPISIKASLTIVRQVESSWKRVRGMFDLFSKVRSRRTQSPFRARSLVRDAEVDQARTASIWSAVDAALMDAERERAGLTRRVDDALARASVTFGNGDDEYLEREALDNHHHDLFDAEISNGQRRLQQLERLIANLDYVKSALLARFPEFQPPQQD